jgi:hypothetical protein
MKNGTPDTHAQSLLFQKGTASRLSDPVRRIAPARLSLFRCQLENFGRTNIKPLLEVRVEQSSNNGVLVLLVIGLPAKRCARRVLGVRCIRSKARIPTSLPVSAILRSSSALASPNTGTICSPLHTFSGHIGIDS